MEAWTAVNTAENRENKAELQRKFWSYRSSFEIKYAKKQAICSLEWTRITALRYYRLGNFYREICHVKLLLDCDEKDPILMSGLFEFYRSLSGEKTLIAPEVH